MSDTKDMIKAAHFIGKVPYYGSSLKEVLAKREKTVLINGVGRVASEGLEKADDDSEDLASYKKQRAKWVKRGAMIGAGLSGAGHAYSGYDLQRALGGRTRQNLKAAAMYGAAGAIGGALKGGLFGLGAHYLFADGPKKPKVQKSDSPTRTKWGVPGQGSLAAYRNDGTKVYAPQSITNPSFGQKVRRAFYETPEEQNFRQAMKETGGRRRKMYGQMSAESRRRNAEKI